MARYENEPRPAMPEDKSRETKSDNSRGRSSGSSASGGNPWDKYRYQLGTPMIERQRYHHKRYGNDKSADCGSAKNSENTGVGAVRKPGFPDWMHCMVIFEPEALMERGQRAAPLSSSRFSLRAELDRAGSRWLEDEKTGITAAFNITLESARILGQKYFQRSFLFADFGEYKDSFHTRYEVNHSGVFRLLREHRANNIDPSEVLERLAALLMMRIPEIKKTDI